MAQNPVERYTKLKSMHELGSRWLGLGSCRTHPDAESHQEAFPNPLGPKAPLKNSKIAKFRGIGKS